MNADAWKPVPATHRLHDVEQREADREHRAELEVEAHLRSSLLAEPGRKRAYERSKHEGERATGIVEPVVQPEPITPTIQVPEKRQRRIPARAEDRDRDQREDGGERLEVASRCGTHTERRTRDHQDHGIAHQPHPALPASRPPRRALEIFPGRERGHEGHLDRGQPLLLARSLLPVPGVDHPLQNERVEEPPHTPAPTRREHQETGSDLAHIESMPAQESGHEPERPRQADVLHPIGVDLVEDVDREIGSSVGSVGFHDVRWGAGSPCSAEATNGSCAPIHAQPFVGAGMTVRTSPKAALLALLAIAGACEIAPQGLLAQAVPPKPTSASTTSSRRRRPSASKRTSERWPGSGPATPSPTRRRRPAESVRRVAGSRRRWIGFPPRVVGAWRSSTRSARSGPRIRRG